VQGVIINAGGIVSYYPSDFNLAHTAQYLGQRDLFGELVEAARHDGLAVLARMDSNRVHAPLAEAHPDWIAVDRQGVPYRAGELFVTSIYSPYYQEFLPGVLREIAQRYQTDGFADNSFSGLGRGTIDYNAHAARRFNEDTGLDLPAGKNWNDPAYRQWVRWSYARRLEIWDINNAAAREAGGEDCLWIGMIGSDPIGQGAAFRDIREICRRAKLVLLDSQSRSDSGGFTQNIEAGLLIHNLTGWDTITPESMAMYEHNGPFPFRVASKPEPEARLWAIAGFAGGIQPWWHHIGAYHEDRRQYRTAESLWRWHEQNEAYLVNRCPVAPVGVAWSQGNADFYGRDSALVRVEQPWVGFTRALQRGRISYQPVHLDDLGRAAEMGLTTLILPNLGAISDEQAQALRDFVDSGGSLVASGESTRFNEWGDARQTSILEGYLGIKFAGTSQGSETVASAGWDDWGMHTYLRLHPEMGAGVYGPRTGREVEPGEGRHAILQGFEETNLLPFGGKLEGVNVESDALQTPVSFVPAFPVYPPELSWMRDPGGRLPAVVLRDLPAGGRGGLPGG
jgi:hypothetical protein